MSADGYFDVAMRALEEVYKDASIRQVEHFKIRCGLPVPEGLDKMTFEEVYMLQLQAEAEWFEKFYGKYLNADSSAVD